ncbi:unnamed protein product [Schistocephalus solidus]|uniref:Uncharacterized protein n=1 Tax=Schistocephalus solidus TaxID=70667 RepID=A0A183SH64_SCHSO|nr:unnamed protein product [Schistocephalus solidus]
MQLTAHANITSCEDFSLIKLESMSGYRRVRCNLRASVFPPHRSRVLGHSRPEKSPGISNEVALSTAAPDPVKNVRLFLPWQRVFRPNDSAPDAELGIEIIELLLRDICAETESRLGQAKIL